MDGGPYDGVTVDGRGAVSAAPDAARISVGVDVVKKDLAAAREEAARQAAAAVAAATGHGVAREDIRTTRFSVRVERDYSKSGQARITGYGVSNQVTITVRDLGTIGGLLDAVIVAGANTVSGPDFFIEHPEDLQDEARRRASEMASRRAGVLAEAAGAALGEIEAISESPGPMPMPRMAMARMAAAPMAVDTPIESGTEEIAVDIRARWGLARR